MLKVLEEHRSDIENGGMYVSMEEKITQQGLKYYALREPFIKPGTDDTKSSKTDEKPWDDQHD